MQNIDKIMKRFGRKFYIKNGKGEILCESRCLTQPLRYKNKMYLEGIPTEIGLNDSNYYLLFAPPELDIKNIADDCCLTDDTNSYYIAKAEDIYCGDKIIYSWAVVRFKEQGDYPYYDHFNKE